VTSKERLRRCYFHEELDRPGVYFRTGYPGDDPTYEQVRAYIDRHTDLKSTWNTPLARLPYPVESYVEPVSQDWQRKVEILHTPAGPLRATHLHSLKGLPGMQKEHFLKSAEDAEKYLSLPLPEFRGQADSFFRQVKEMGDRGIVEAPLGPNPAGLVANLFGSETFALLSVTDRPVLHALCRRQMEINLRRLKCYLELGVGPYFQMAGEEFCVPPLHGPRDFRDFNYQYDKPVVDLIHESGGRIHIHCHGSIRKVFPHFVEMGVDVLHPIEPPPMGDLPAGEAKELAAGKITIEGNIQIAHMYEHAPQQVRQEAEQLIADAFGDRRGLIVCPTASLYQRGKGDECFQQCKAMIDAVLDWKT